ncbi:hypothetical protein INT43_005024 [Umbelopsis isabellina]|uniref:Phosphatidylethanolamine N-methyltransferase n=1 Tax=Mortierella isabellina TaxID=91625 RepID=A0A8H7PGM5_MORIS|nr:hypothetical protein INT43_005024 [Umbelopsis isabellina]
MTELRQRHVGAESCEPVPVDEREEHGDWKKDKEDTLSYGKTPDGKLFRVPTTHDMLKAVLDPKSNKTFFDLFTLGVMGFEIFLFFVLPDAVRRYLFLVLFAFWRLSYNFGLGVLLKYQSDSRGLVNLAKKYKVFDAKRNPKVHNWLKYQFTRKMGQDYNFDSVPIEFNTWLLYRQLVDLILMNDFTTYLCFALSWFNATPKVTFFLSDPLRWIGGLFLIVFNIWVKVDAQRVVKDFAWYWGDFFFLIEQSLTFDGVFEMAPHPMYSVGYVGYYGLSLMCASYTVLYVSLFAHACQFAFLAFVETPHIEKTYNPPPTPTRRETESPSPMDGEQSSSQDVIHNLDQAASRDFYANYFRRDLIVFKNFDLFRSTDFASLLVMIYAAYTPLFAMSGSAGVTYAVGQAFVWRVFHSYVLGGLLHRQSKDKFITRHFLKWGGTVQDAYNNWKSVYNLSLCMTYVTFFVACWKMYTLPEDWTYGTTLLRHTLGFAFLGFHIWTSVSIYEVLGDFGWFYGDFFFDDQPLGLVYSGIYRYLNNPEKIMGHAAFWGMTLMANSWIIFILALFSQISNFLFLNYVESPHMQKLYGDQIRKEAGLTKTLRSAAVALPKSIPDELRQEVSKMLREQSEIQAALSTSKSVERIVKETVEKVERVVEETAGAVGDMVEAARPRLQEMVADTKILLENSTSRFLLPQVTSDLDAYDLSKYSLTIDDKPSELITFTFGQPIALNWTAPPNHGSKDWIGVYKVTANKSKHVTSISSKGLWTWTNPNMNEAIHEDSPAPTPRATDGRVVFLGDKLPWEIGSYEFRYHHDGKHNVMARSRPFDIVAPESDPEDVESIQQTVLEIVQHSLGDKEELIPRNMNEEYVSMPEDSAKRVVYAIRMTYGVDFAWEVVASDLCAATLCKRVTQALRALSPFVRRSKRMSIADKVSSSLGSPSPDRCSPVARIDDNN